jgi:alpha-beta hydrolase superfamily lysophospholipase
MQSRIRRRVLKIASALAVTYLLASGAAAAFLAEVSLRLPRRPITARWRFAAEFKEHAHAEMQDVALTVSDGTVLRAWYAAPPNANGSTVILLHGVTDTREGVAWFGDMFLEHGYAVLLPDSRAHGESGGAIATYGVKERYDVRDWARWAKQHESGCVYLFGESMGAAISLQAAAVTPEVCAVAVESPFAHFREIAYDRISYFSGLGPWFPRTLGRPALELSLVYARLRYGVDLTQADPGAAMEHSRVPELLLHGTEDHNISLRHSLLLMKVGGSHAELWQVQGAAHGNAVEVAPGEFESRILGWYQSHPHI